MAPRRVAAKAASEFKTTANTSKKREREEDVAKPAASKRQKAVPAPAKKTAPARTAAAPAKKVAPVKKAAAPKKTPQVINDAPTTVRHIFVMGEGSAGELGLGATKGACNVKRPRLNQLLDKMGVVDIAVGGMHCIALTNNNELLTWGVNDNKALGRILPPWEGKEVDADASDSEDEEDEGMQLNPNEATPTAIPASAFPEGTVFTQVGAGDSQSYAVTSSGLVYGWGTYRNDQGIWGFSIDPKTGKVIKEQPVPMPIPNLKNITSISCGDNHTLALDSKGVVYAWGSGQQDQLGRRIVARHATKNLIAAPVPIPKKAKISKIVAGPNHSFAIEENGTVWTWGLNNFAQTGIPYPEDQDNDLISKPEKVSSLEGKKIIDIACGSNHSIALTSSGELFAFGRLENYALGLDFKPFENDASLVRKNEAGKPKILLVPQKITFPNNEKITFIGAGSDSNIATTEEGKAYAWGFNANLQLGVGRDADEVRVPEVLVSKWIADVKLDWVGVGGQFSVLGGVDK